MKLIKNIQLMVFVSFLILVLSGCNPSTPPEEITQIYFNYLAAFEHQRAYDFLSQHQKLDLKTKNINRESYFGYVKPPFGHPLWMGISIDIISQAVEADGSSRVQFRLTENRSKQSITGECHLVIEENEWRINNVKLENISEETQSALLQTQH